MRIGFVFLFFLTQATFAQFKYVIDQSIPVTLQDDEFLSMPWAGGLNAAQFNTIDLNEDGNEDLAIFDRTAERVATFINDNNQYRYAPEYEIFFPAEITNWMLLRDYNGDGKKDIFTGDNLGIKVYTNVTPSGEALQWEQFLFPGIGSKSPVLLTTGFSGKINVQLNGDDLPAISDADGDGDFDLFVPKYPSGSTIEFHKNLSVENGEPLDSLDFARTPLTPTAWGGVTECDCGIFAFNGDPCNTGGKVKHAGGKSLFAFDADDDGDQDILISESTCTQLFLLRNDGTNLSPVINTASAFPSVSPAFIITYPTAFYEDVDFDGVKDLIATPNIFAREFLQTDFKQSVWFYKNAGTTSLPSFVSPNPNFLQEDMIDVGDHAVPAFFDADGDGDLDLFIGYYTDNFSGSICYFKNSGSQSQPSFTLVTNDFFGISFLNLINIKPSFADMNGDSKIDLVFIASNQFGGETQLFYFANNNGSGINLSPELIPVNFSAPVGSTPEQLSSSDNVCVEDVNLDGKNDLLVGRQDGRLQYWRNTGTASTPTYTLENEAYLGLSMSVLRRSPSFATADLNADAKADLIMGDQTGKLTIINNYRDATDAMVDGISNLIYNPIEEGYEAQNLGGRVWPTVANIFKADKPAIVVGNTLGGLHILKHDESIPLPKKPVIDVYPNPVAKETSLLTIKVDRAASLIMLTSLGQEVSSPAFLQAFQEYDFQIQGLSRGIYLLYFTIEGKTYTRKIILF